MSTPTAVPEQGPAASRDAGAAPSSAAPADVTGAPEPAGDGGTGAWPAQVDDLVPADRRRLRRAWLAGTAPVMAVYTWVLTVGRLDFLQRNYFDDFFDAQARAMFDGRLDVPREVVWFEGFLIDGKTYIYFGPVPALLRMPVLAVTDRFDGRLTTLSMLLAFAVLAAATFRLACVVRAMVRGAAPLAGREPLAMGVLAVATLAAPPFFLASSAVVYHEAALWGLALTVASFDAIARWLRRPTAGRLAAASALVTCAVLSRQSLGFGPLVALGLASAVVTVRLLRLPGEARPGPARLARTVLPLAVAGLVPIAAAVAMNQAKFGTILTPPSDRHLASLLHPGRQEVLEAHQGSLFGFEFVPTTLKQYLRPDGIDVRVDFPWLDFPRLGPSLVGDTSFDALDWSSSLPASAPALTATTLVTIVWVVRRARRGLPGPPWLGVLCVGALAGGSGVVAIGYVANRYLNDLFPLVLIPGIAGFHLAMAAAPRWSRRRRRLAVGGAAGLVALGALANVALALSYQRERGPVVPETWRAEWVSWRVGVPGDYEPYVVPADWPFLPNVAFDGRLTVVGDCDGLYARVGADWLGVERGPGVGVHDLRIDLDELSTGVRAPLITLGTGKSMTIVAIRRLDDDRVRVDVSQPPARGGGWSLGTPIALAGEVTLRVAADSRQAPSMVTYGRVVLNGAVLDADGHPLYGRAPPGHGVAETYPGDLALDPVEPRLCREALARASDDMLERARSMERWAEQRDPAGRRMGDDYRQPG